VEIDSSFAEAWNKLGNVLAELGCCMEAIAAYARVLDLGRGNADVHHAMADMLDQMGRLVDARPHWEACIRYGAHTPHAAYARQRLAATAQAQA
jgi:predicted RNA polymerase sigma factor